MEKDSQKTINNRLAPCVSHAVGVSEGPKWYVAFVSNNTEKSSRDKLLKRGYAVYLPVKTEFVKWKDGRCKEREHILMPNILFIRITEAERKVLVAFPFIRAFMTDMARAKEGNRHPFAVVPEAQIETLKYMLGQSEINVEMEGLSIAVGEKVRVIRGVLQGLVGMICTTTKGEKVGIRIDGLGYACVNINKRDLETVKQWN
ncbi:MAG: UpxY family transcription antiterminator [Bacteroidales bacterium]|nr:UpxY family transcription antiterminator [Bacteroidales bacterium]